MRVLVTGASGFVGSHVVRTLLERGPENHEVFILSRKQKPGALADILGGSSVVEVLLGDIEQPEDVCRAVEKAAPDLIFHLAGVYAWWQPDQGRYERVNVDGVRHLLAACSRATGSAGDGTLPSPPPAPAIVHVSTVLAFGNPSSDPERTGLTPATAFNEDTEPGEAASLYASSKHAGDLLAQAAFDRQEVEGCTCFLACCIGRDPKLLDPERDVMKIKALVEGKVPAVIAGETTFTYVYVKDAAEAIVRAGERLMGARRSAGGSADVSARSGRSPSSTSKKTGERYLVGNQRLKTDVFYDLIAELSGTPRPRREVPAWLALGAGRVSAFLASNLTKSAPTAPADLVRTATKGTLLFDAVKSELELGMEYTDIRVAFREAVDFIMGK